MNRLRFVAVVLLLLITALILNTRSDTDRTPATEPLSAFPNSIAGWNGSDQPIDNETLEVLGAGDFLSRNYTRGARTAPIDLFIAYFPTQRTGVSIHSPKNCLPGAGWSFESSDTAVLTDANGKPRRVGEYIITNGGTRQFVIYWYQSHGRSIPGEYMARIYMVADAISTNRTDGALVRVITPFNPSEPTIAARERAEEFTRQFASFLPRFIPN